jgi:TolA-binding protein
MSIIADTLTRLQAQSEDPLPKSMDAPLPRPAFNKGEGSGRHRKDSPFRFLVVMVWMTITLGGLAVAAFWIGGHLDFGLATKTQARANVHRSLPITPHRPEDPTLHEQSSETFAAAVEEPSQFPKKSTTADNNEQTSVSIHMETDSSTTPLALPHEEVSSSLSKNTTDDPVSAKIMVSTTFHNEESLSDAIDQPNTNNEELMTSLADSDEPSSLIGSTEHPELTTEYPASDRDIADQTDEPEFPNLVTVSEEEIIQAEEFVEASTTVIDSVNGPTNFAALKARLKSANPTVSTTSPLQPSPATRLRHAQQLIQAGEYEDAITLLSPLFHDPPMKWQPWFWMGTALLGKGEIDQADQYFLSGLARNDKIPQLWIQRALVAQQRGDFQLAIHELRQAESIAADMPHIHLNMGYAYEQLGNNRMANQYYGKFLKLSEGQSAFFSTRKKLFARLTKTTPTQKLSPLSSRKP